jgi:hypothetical protein
MTRTLKTGDGTILHYSDIDGVNKLHNWDGPAIIPQGNNRLAEYYIYGIKYSKEEWVDRKRDTNGLPWFKTAIGKASNSRV